MIECTSWRDRLDWLQRASLPCFGCDSKYSHLQLGRCIRTLTFLSFFLKLFAFIVTPRSAHYYTPHRTTYSLRHGSVHTDVNTICSLCTVFEQNVHVDGPWMSFEIWLARNGNWCNGEETTPRSMSWNHRHSKCNHSRKWGVHVKSTNSVHHLTYVTPKYGTMRKCGVTRMYSKLTSCSSSVKLLFWLCQAALNEWVHQT